MADSSKIEWTEATWNPVVGCTHVSPGCDNCYAAREASGRLKNLPLYAGLAAGGKFTGEVRLVENRLSQPLRWRRPRRVFVNSMSDLFHDGVPDEYIAEVFAVMAAAHRHTFQLLTKRHARMRALLTDGDFRALVCAESATLAHEGVDVTVNNPWETWPLPNVWLGVSVEDQKWADIRIPALLGTPATVRFLSCEPLLGPVDLDQWLCSCDGRRWVDDENWSPEYPEMWRGERSIGDGRIPCGFCNPGGWNEDDVDRQGIGWVIVGGESGPRARPMHPDWARSLRDRCSTAAVPFFFKQHGEWAPIGPLYEQSTDDTVADAARMEAVGLEVVYGVDVVELESSGYIAQGHQPTDPRTWLMARLGKKQAGRALDGRTHDEYPGVAGG